MSQLLIGADPEVFVKDASTDEIQSSIGVLPGSKRKPYKGNQCFIHKDNVLAEFSVVPSATEQDFVFNVLASLREVSDLLAKKGKTTAILASCELDEVYTSHYLAQHFGCDPDFNVWELDAYERIFNSGEFGNLRTAGGHIHIGFPEGVTMENQILTVKACEVFIGLPSVFLDKDTRRKSLYGASGSFRPKDYGVEYRVPSNFWLQSHSLMRWVYSGAIQSWQERHWVDSFQEKEIKEIRDTINNNDADKALKLCDTYGINYGD